MRRMIAWLLAGLLAAPPAAGMTLKIATLLPDGTAWMKTMRQSAKEIRQRTNGRVKLRFYPGGVMGNDASVLRKIRVGQLHGGAVTGGAAASICKDTLMYSLPFLFHNLPEVDYVRERLDPYIIECLKKGGFISFGLAEGGFAYFMSSHPIRTLADIRHRRVWIPEGDRISETALDALGITPITLPITDVLTGLQTGLIDTIASSPVGAIALQWHTRVKYLTDMPLMYIYATLVISERAFNRIPSQDRAVLTEVLTRAFRDIDHRNRSDNLEAKMALKQQGIEFVTPSAADMRHWRSRVEQAVQHLQQDRYLSSQSVDHIRQLLREYRQQQVALPNPGPHRKRPSSRTAVAHAAPALRRRPAEPARP